jgi:hypothetical protein
VWKSSRYNDRFLTISVRVVRLLTGEMALLLFLGLDFLLLIFENPVYRYITLLANKQNRAHMILRIRKPKHEIENL